MLVPVNSNFTTFYLQSFVGRFISRISFKSASIGMLNEYRRSSRFLKHVLFLDLLKFFIFIKFILLVVGLTLTTCNSCFFCFLYGYLIVVIPKFNYSFSSCSLLLVFLKGRVGVFCRCVALSPWFRVPFDGRPRGVLF